jgi:hypothetical protein
MRAEPHFGASVVIACVAIACWNDQERSSGHVDT